MPFLNNIENLYFLQKDSIFLFTLPLGTDFAGYNITFDKGFPITEVTLMKDAGMSNMDIIIAATKNDAHVCGLNNEIGTIIKKQ